MAVQSNWKISFGPDQTTPLVLVDVGDFLEGEIPFVGRKAFDTARPLEGAGVSNYSRGQVEETFAFSVEKDHSSLEESREYCFDHAITLAGTATDILQVEVPDGKIYRLSSAVIMDWSRQVVPKVGVHRTRWTYRIGGGVWSEHTPEP